MFSLSLIQFGIRASKSIIIRLTLRTCIIISKLIILIFLFVVTGPAINAFVQMKDYRQRHGNCSK